MDASRLNRRCPKCGGNLFLYNDYQGWYEQCLQCSFTHYLDVVYEDNKKKAGSNSTSGTERSRLSRV